MPLCVRMVLWIGGGGTAAVVTVAVCGGWVPFWLCGASAEVVVWGRGGAVYCAALPSCRCGPYCGSALCCALVPTRWEPGSGSPTGREFVVTFPVTGGCCAFGGWMPLWVRMVLWIGGCGTADDVTVEV